MDLSAIEDDIYDDIDVVKRIRIQRRRWLGHVARMDSSNPVRKLFESEPGGGSCRKGRLPQRWAKQVDENECWVSEICAKLQQDVMYDVAN